MAQVLLSGSSGFVGRRLAQHFTHAGVDVFGVDEVAGPTTRLKAHIDPAFDSLERVRAIVHCAARVSVIESVANPAHTIADNLGSTLGLLDFARRRDVPRFLLFSSAAVYGDPGVSPIPEITPLRPLSPYGTSKRLCEELAGDFGRHYGLHVTSVRPFNIYHDDLTGAGSYAGVVKVFHEQLRQGKPVTIYGDGSQTRDFIHLDDVRSFVEHWLAERVPPGTYNLGTGRDVSVLDLAGLFFRFSGQEPRIEFAPSRPGEILRSQAELSRAQATGWAPRVSLEDGIQRLVAAQETSPKRPFR